MHFEEAQFDMKIISQISAYIDRFIEKNLILPPEFWWTQYK